MFWFFSGKKEVKKIREEVKGSFDLVKKDIKDVGEWIKHLNSEKETHKKDISEVKEVLSSVKNDLEEIKKFISEIEMVESERVFKTPKQVFRKQTGVYAVQTPVQTGILDNLSITERAIMFTLLNAGDMKLSYEDLAAMLGKDKATIRGQVNSIRQKNEGLLEEIVGENNKKRLFIPLEVRDILLKAKKIKSKEKKRKEMEDY